MPSAPTVASPRPRAAGAAPARPDVPARHVPLGREIAVVLALKLIALVLLWFAFFRPAEAPSVASAVQAVAAHVAGPATPSEASLVAH